MKGNPQHFTNFPALFVVWKIGGSCDTFVWLAWVWMFWLYDTEECNYKLGILGL